eukprot:6194044-Pleurochrysis_carterae.AAC.1
MDKTATSPADAALLRDNSTKPLRHVQDVASGAGNCNVGELCVENRESVRRDPSSPVSVAMSMITSGGIPPADEPSAKRGRG